MVKDILNLALTKDEAKELLKVAKGNLRDYQLFYLALNLGLRSVEVVNLKWEHFAPLKDGKYRVLVPTAKSKKKGMHENVVSISVETAVRDKLLGWARGKTSGWIFPGRTSGEPLTTAAVRLLWRKYADLAKIPKGKSFHCLRHTRAVNVYLDTRNIYEVKLRLRHSSVTSSEVYLRWVNEMEAEKKYRDKTRVFE